MSVRHLAPVTLVVAAAVVVLGAAAIGMEPRPLLLAAVVIAVGAMGWGLRTLTDAAADPIAWPEGEPDTAVASDWQVAALRSRIAYGASDAYASEALRRTLVALVDDRLISEYGVDRRDEPEAAREILGDELSRFVTEPGASQASGRRWNLERIVSLLETR